MASGTIQKHTINETAAQIEHNNIDRDGKNGKKHKNKDINPELSKYNVYVDKRSKMEILDDIKNDVASIDAVCPPKRKTKDRVVTLEIEYTTPRELAPVLPYKPTKEEEDALIEKYVLNQMDTINDFLIDGESAIKEKYGKTYGTTIHYDECHYYYDKADKMYHMSRPHLHTFVTAQAEIMEKTGEKDDKGKDIYTGTGQYRINGKDALKRSTYKEINKLLDAPSQKYYGCTFEDGRGKKSEGSVEAMKAASIRAEQEAHENLKAQNEDSRVIAKAIIDKLDAQEEQIAENSKTLLEQENKKKENDKTLTEQEQKKAEYEAFTKTFHQPTDYKKVKVFGKKETHYAVPEHELWHYCAAADDVQLKDKELKDKDTVYDALNEKYQKEQNSRDSYQKSVGRYQNKEKQMKDDFKKRLERAKNNPFTSNSVLSELIHSYAFLEVTNEKERQAILKACEALDTLDEYQHKIDKKIPFFTLDDEADRLSITITALNKRVKDEYIKILDYGGRKEMYDDISALWKSSKSVSTEIYKKYGKKASSVQSLQATYTPIITGILSDLFSLVRMAFEMIQEASRGYDR